MSAACFIFAFLSLLGSVVAPLLIKSQADRGDELAGLATSFGAVLVFVSSVAWSLFFTVLGVTILFLGESIKIQADIAENTRRTAESVAELARHDKS
jgi:hypothetical protein